MYGRSHIYYAMELVVMMVLLGLIGSDVSQPPFGHDDRQPISLNTLCELTSRCISALNYRAFHLLKFLHLA